MTTKQFIRLMAILALAAFSFAACKKGATNTNNTNNPNNTSNTAANKNAPATPPKGDYSTPTAAFKTFYEAAKANDIEGIKRSVSKKTLEMMTKDAAKDNKTIDDTLKETAKGAPSSFPETRNEKIDGDKATLEFKDDKMDKWSTGSFVKENGEWKLAIGDEADAAMDKMEGMDQGKK